MDAFLNFFEQMPSWQKLVWVICCLVFTSLIEVVSPLVRFNNKSWKHARINLTLLLVTLTINVIFGLITVGLFQWMHQHKIGLLYYVQLPIWIELLISLMWMDLIAQYGVHYMLHRIKWMWKMHMVHHSDTKVDATTGTRHHPGDYFLRELSALVAVVLIGAPLAYYLLYRICTVFFTYATHANINMPRWLDRPLSWIFVTPNMHKFHHHFERPWTDSNFGNIFSIWDRIFGTLVYDDPKKVKYGLDVLDKTSDENLLFQLKIPFNKGIKTDY